MLERLMITFAIGGGLLLLWLGWQYGKKLLIKTVPSTEMPTGKPSLLYFTGEYCAICKVQQTPVVNQLAGMYDDALAVEIFDVTSHPDAAKKYKVLTLPTTVILDPQGRVADINYGFTGQAKLEKQIAAVELKFAVNSCVINEFQPVAQG